MSLLIFLLIIMFLLLSFSLLIVLIFTLFRAYMQRRSFPTRLTYVTIGCIIVLLGLVMYRTLMYTFPVLDKLNPYTEHKSPIHSPSQKYAATALYELYGGAAGGVNLIVKITNLATNDEKIIYYADAQHNIRLNWIDEETLHIINQSQPHTDFTITLNVNKEIYHASGYACRSLLMKNSYETCYSASNRK